ncbi:MAG: GNAT family N-acetyltransferase [Acetatifactor sp.]
MSSKEIFATIDLPGYPGESVVLAGEPEQVREALGRGQAAVMVLDEESPSPDMEGIPYVVYENDLPDRRYFQRVYERVKDIPWTMGETKRCILREMVPSDGEAFLQLYRETPGACFLKDGYESAEEWAAFIEDYRNHMYRFYEFGMWTVILKETGEIIGRVGLSMGGNEGIPQLGYFIAAPWQRRGLALEVSLEVLRIAKEELSLDRLLLYTAPDNLPSIKLAGKLQFLSAGRGVAEGCTVLRFERRL